MLFYRLLKIKLNLNVILVLPAMKRCSLFIVIALILFGAVHCEILSQSFVVRLNDMAKVIEDQKTVIEDQKKIIEEASLQSLVTEQRNIIESLNISNRKLEETVDEVTQELEIFQTRINRLENPTSMIL